MQVTRYGENHMQVHHNGRQWFISYDTVVAYRDGAGNSIRRDHNYSTTTAKHMTQMGVKAWKQVPDDEFEKIANG